jgi:hypothetical protein
LAIPAWAGQEGAQAAPSSTVWTARNLTRVEMWSFFTPPPSGGDPDSVYVGNRLQLGVSRRTARYDASILVQYVQFGGLPADAIGPGPLGLGAAYYTHAGRSDSHQVYLRYLNVRLKDLAPGLSVQVGRQPYTSGAESGSGVPKIEAVKRQRIDARLVGEFEFSLYQRAFDGVRVDLSKPTWSATAVAFRPTQGGFEDAAGITIDGIGVIGANLTLKPGTAIPRTDWQLFGFHYDDDRPVTDVPDNTGRTSTKADVAIATFGTALVTASTPGKARQWDALVWMAGQTGDWYGQVHRAYAVAVEGGHQWSQVAWSPWVRAGILEASGDDDPNDDRHSTFFQMLPTVRRFSLSTLNSQMNNRDLFVQTILRPRPALAVRVDLHRLDLASRHDRWYYGSGASREEGSPFGFGTRPSNAATRLGTMLEGSADYTISRHWSVNGYVGFGRGGEVVQRSFARSTLTYSYLEAIVQF